MARRPSPQGGVPARYAGFCLVCKGDVAPGDYVFYRRGKSVHIGCKSGADDE
jgi:hypothetical protein